MNFIEMITKKLQKNCCAKEIILSLLFTLPLYSYNIQNINVLLRFCYSGR